MTAKPRSAAISRKGVLVVPEARGPRLLFESRGIGRVLALAVAVVAALVSAPAMRNGLFWDDAIVLARQVPAMGSVGRAFFPPAGLPQFIPEYYRPVVFLTLLLDRSIWGSSVMGLHLTVLLLHAFASAAVFWLVWIVVRQGSGEPDASGLRESVPRSGVPFDPNDGRRRSHRVLGAALVSGLLFAVHPAHAEAVAWIMGRADVLAALCATVSLIGVIAMRDGRSGASAIEGTSVGIGRWIALLVIVATSAASLLSKESAIVLPVLALIVLWAVGARRPPGEDRGTSRHSILGGGALALGAVALGVVLALALRVLALRSSAAAVAAAAAAGGAEPGREGPSLLDAAGALLFGIRRLVWPWPVPVFHSKVPPIDLVSGAATVVFLILVVAAARASRSGRAAALFTGVALLPALAPAMTRVSLSPVADRYLYLPSVGMCWMAGVVVSAAFTRGWNRSHEGSREASWIRGAATLAVTLPLAAWTIAGAATSFRGVAMYKDDATFWSTAIERSPSDPFLLMKRGQTLGAAGRFDEAAADLRRALELGGSDLSRSTRTVMLDNLGDIALRRDRLDEAQQWLDQALTVGPGYGLAHLHMARLLRTRALAAAKRSDPSNAGTGEAASQWGLAVASVDRAVALEPTNTEALLLRADLALDLGDKAKAVASIQEALRYMPEGSDRTRIEAALRSLGG